MCEGLKLGLEPPTQPHLHAFLFEHAKFSFPVPARGGHANSADISCVGLSALAPEWKAQYAIRDETFIQKFCQALEDIVGDALVPGHLQDQLLSKLGDRLRFPVIGDQEEDPEWTQDRTESHSRTLLDSGLFLAVNHCFITSCRVDYTASVGDVPLVLIEAKSPSVVIMVGNSLPPRGIKFKRASNLPLAEKVLLKCIGRFISGSEEDGMDVPHVPQLLDRLSSRHKQ
ncbi:hypothetical protein H4582DRAFT_543296 [Lactarius indigo]|nr:hypothetical protein H4582DRAFT_543296 [Lactarius indigo]